MYESCDHLTAVSTSSLSTGTDELSGDVTTNQKDTLGVSLHRMTLDTLYKVKTIKSMSSSQTMPHAFDKKLTGEIK